MSSTLLRYGLPLTAAMLLAFALATSLARPARTSAEPAIAPARTPYPDTVAGMGTIEPNTEVVGIGTHIAGVVETVHVRVNQRVKRGDALFSIDPRDARARLAAEEARLASMQVAAADAQRQLDLYRSVDDPRAVSRDELDRRRYAADAAAKAALEAAARVDVIRTEVARLTVRAPFDGTVLRVEMRPGEFAATGKLRDPSIALGNVDPLHVRVEVDEADAARYSPQARATLHVRGGGPSTTALRFVRIEPLLRPKRTLTGDGNERVDTRVLEAIYALDDRSFKTHVGQQVDVYIEAAPRSPKSAAPGGSAS